VTQNAKIKSAVQTTAVAHAEVAAPTAKSARAKDLVSARLPVPKTKNAVMILAAMKAPVEPAFLAQNVVKTTPVSAPQTVIQNHAEMMVAAAAAEHVQEIRQTATSVTALKHRASLPAKLGKNVESTAAESPHADPVQPTRYAVEQPACAFPIVVERYVAQMDAVDNVALVPNALE
jgi:hypothetical protein